MKELDSRKIWKEDDIENFSKENWKDLGLAPLFLKLLVDEKGWWPELIDDAFSQIIGTDYQQLKVTDWIERLEDVGFEFPDGKPVLDILHNVIGNIYSGIQIGLIGRILGLDNIPIDIKNNTTH